MFRSLLLFVMVTFPLIAANPKIFSGIGDPLYNDLPATEKISGLYAFKAEQNELKAFINDVKEAKKKGFTLQKTRDQATAKNYLKMIRQLSVQNEKQRYLIKKRLLETIEADYVKRYRQIIATAHPLFKQDPQLKKAVTIYNRKLHKRQKVADKKHVKYLRSAANFKGVWKNSLSTWRFTATELTIIHDDGARYQKMRGKWKLESQYLLHTVSSVINQKQGKHAHKRETSATQYYTLLSVSTTTLKVKDVYGEIHTLKKK